MERGSRVLDSKYFLLVVGVLFLFSFVSAAEINDDLHLNLQTTDSEGRVVTGTFDFQFDISTDATCSNIIYSDSQTLTTDSRGIISYYLNNTDLDYAQQYYLCYYRDTQLIDTIQIARTPYAFTAKNVNLSGVLVDSNLNLSGFNLSADYLFGDGSQLTNLPIDQAGLNYWNRSGDDLFYNLGNIGIGTDSPRGGLDIGDNDLYIGNHPTDRRIYFGNIANYFTRGEIHTTQSNLGLYNDYSNGYITMNVNSGEAMRISNDGRVGIGTDSPGQLLDVEGNISLGSNNFMFLHTDADTHWLFGKEDNNIIVKGYPGGNRGFEVLNGVDDSVAMHVNFDGNLGVGTSSPLYKIDINTSSNDAFRIVDSLGSSILSGAGLTIDRSTAYLTGSGNLRIRSGGSDTMILDTSNRVGLGATPQYKLDVNGTVRADSFIGDGSQLTNLNITGLNGSTQWMNNGDDIYYNLGNVGIGVSNPTGDLEVAQSSDEDGIVVRGYDDENDKYGSLQIDQYGNFEIFSKGTNRFLNFYSDGAIQFQADSTGGSRDQLILQTNGDVIMNDGNVGIGVSNLVGDLQLGDASKNELFILNGQNNNASSSVIRFGDGSSSFKYSIQQRFDSSLNALFVEADNNGDFVPENLMTFERTGGIGIGTINPEYKLDVNGTVRANSFIGDGSQLTNLSVDVDSVNFWNKSGNDLYYNDGRVGIGTDSPEANLEVSGVRSIKLDSERGLINIVSPTGSWATGYNFESSSGGSLGGYGAFGAQDSLNYYYIGESWSSPIAVFTSEGNVGIGTSNPGADLDIRRAGQGSAFIRMWDSRSDVGDFVGIKMSTAKTIPEKTAIAHVETGAYGAGDLVFALSGTVSESVNLTLDEKMRIANNGNVGIGTSDPEERLHVAGGNMRIDTSAGNLSVTNRGSGSVDIKSSGVLGIGSSTDSDIVFETSRGEIMRIDSSEERVGINESSPEASLHVSGDVIIEL